ncbi:LysM domain-containing protein [Carnobacterium iners]|uniref:LysM domain-containing protein n=1 Tax=Carnobacterium iners TaxID=1073423 RepID=A0A1X7NF22_9LACT|nr:LysM peptidoglycan-binding domain-containing protein [Carnobacterium iners]SEK36150.1 LysM domain-containing protein [Carnobacterium iners]SMH35460.1 LysM domain-containing protein [Carnobacterium iners]
MSKKDSKNNKDNEVWTRKFENNVDDEKDTSLRGARKKAERGISPVATSLIIFLALLFILPIATYTFILNERSDEEGFKANEDRVTITKSSSSEKLSSKKKDSASEKPTLSVSTEEVIEKAPEQPAPVEEKPIVTEPVAPVTPEPEVKEPVVEETSKTYTVVAGDNLYRIGLNHGMTTAQLRALNGLTSDSVSVGTVLKVK